jgi:hypothetical protein
VFLLEVVDGGDEWLEILWIHRSISSEQPQIDAFCGDLQETGNKPPNCVT